jgi:site-specific recombinase XerD
MEALPTVIEGQANLPGFLLEEVEAAKGFAMEQHAGATRRAYVSDARIFASWCYERGLAAMPASPDTVCVFLASQAKDGVKVSTLSRRVAAIRYAHSLAGMEPPTNTEMVKATMKGIRRTMGAAPKQKAAATAERVTAMVGQVHDNLQGLRDRALILLGFAGAFRRSELAALTVEDLVETEDGYRVTIRKSKTDQEGKGHEIAIYRGSRLRAVEAVKAWLEAARIEAGPIFRPLAKGGRVLEQALSTKSVAAIVKDYAERAGFDPEEFSGHSLRAGFLTSAAENGASIFKMMEVSRHKSVDTLRGYVRRAELFKDHAGSSFL